MNSQSSAGINNQNLCLDIHIISHTFVVMNTCFNQFFLGRQFDMNCKKLREFSTQFHNVRD